MTQELSRAAARHAELSRRNFLRGVGACVALPLFQSLGTNRLLAELPAAARLAMTASGTPLRTAFVYFPNGAIPASWWPAQAGADFAWSRTLKPLENHKNALQVMGELDHKTAEPGPDGAGDHAARQRHLPYRRAPAQKR